MAAEIMNLSKQEIQKLQYDLLWNSIRNNAYLPASDIEILNKSLNTNAKSIIKAINEVHKRSLTVQDTLYKFQLLFNGTTGEVTKLNIESDPMYAKLRQCGNNVIDALYSLKTQFQSLYNSCQEQANDVDEKLASFQETINNANAIITELEKRLTVIKDDKCGVISYNTINLSYIPVKNNNLKFFINGIYYPLENFNINTNSKIVEWKFTDFAGGFDLNSGDYEVIAEYNKAEDL